MLTRRDWWLGVALIFAALVTDGCWPRFEWHALPGNAYARFDRWTGYAMALPYERQPPISVGEIVSVEQPARPWRYIKVFPGWPPIDLAVLVPVALMLALLVAGRRWQKRRASVSKAPV
jgi:hypothetical protein